MKRYILFLTIVISTATSAQTAYTTESSTHIFWQPDVKLKYSDFQGDTTSKRMDFCRKYNTSASASVGIWSILDVPKKKKDRGKKLEKVYFAPAFDKKGSFAVTQDTVQIAIQAVYFDICEVAARVARRKLKALQDSMKAYGTLYIMYATEESDMQKMKSEMWASYTREVIVEKKPGAYESWRKFYDEMLDKTKEWATKPEECYRLLSGQPVEDGYEKSETIMPAMPDKKK